MDQRDLKELVSMIGFRMLQNYNKQNIYYDVLFILGFYLYELKSIELGRYVTINLI